jgi:hypothetical protein
VIWPSIVTAAFEVTSIVPVDCPEKLTVIGLLAYVDIVIVSVAKIGDQYVQFAHGESPLHCLPLAFWVKPKWHCGPQPW